MDSYPKAARRMAAIAAIALVALASSLAGQEPKRPGQEGADSANRPEPGAELAGSLAILLREPAVHAELELTAEQVAALEAAMAEIDHDLWLARDVSPDKSGPQVSALVARVEARLPEILREAQRDRLRQILLQSQRLSLVALPEVIDKLGVSAVQARRIEKLLADMRRNREKRKGGGDSSQAQPAQSAESDERKLLAVFTVRQQQQLKALVGKPFDFSRIRYLYSKAPGLAGISQWINSEPLALEQLRGRVVALHFFAFG
jgi:hypothetical protein